MRTISKFVSAVLVFFMLTTGVRAEELVQPAVADSVSAQQADTDEYMPLVLPDDFKAARRATNSAGDSARVVAGIVSFGALMASVFTKAPDTTLGLLGVSIGADQAQK